MLKTVDSATCYPIYNTNIPAKVLMGWEYEIDIPTVLNADSWRNKVNKIRPVVGPEFTFTLDGGHSTLNGYTYGVEVRSPVGPLFLAKHWAKTLKPFTRECPHHNGPNNNGGIHVNISKNEFTKKVWPKVKDFLHNRKYYKLLFSLSDRSPRSFDLNACQGSTEFHTGIITASKSYAYELRMFGAHTDTFFPALEFADAVFRFADIVDTIIPDDFFAWIDKQPKYAELSKYIAAKLQ